MKTATLKTLILAAVSGLSSYSIPAAAGTVWATDATFFEIGNVDPGRAIKSNALGDDLSTFRSLSLYGLAVFEFDKAFWASSVTIWETTYGDCTDDGNGLCSHWEEEVEVFVTNDGFDSDSNTWDSNLWTSLGTLGNYNAQLGGSPSDSNSVSGAFNYLILADQGLSTDSPQDGFDVAAVSVSAVPIPAAAWLFGSALAGMAGIGYRRSRRC